MQNDVFGPLIHRNVDYPDLLLLAFMSIKENNNKISTFLITAFDFECEFLQCNTFCPVRLEANEKRMVTWRLMLIMCCLYFGLIG